MLRRVIRQANCLLHTLIKLVAIAEVTPMFDNNLIISTKEARKILGKEYAKYSDEQITRMIKQLDSIAEAYIKSVPKY